MLKWVDFLKIPKNKNDPERSIRNPTKKGTGIYCNNILFAVVPLASKAQAKRISNILKHHFVFYVFITLLYHSQRK